MTSLDREAGHARKRHERVWPIALAAAAVLLTLPSAAVPAGPPGPPSVSLFEVTRRFSADGGTGPFALAEGPLAETSDSVWADGRLLERGLDYVVDTGRGALTLTRPLPRGVEIVARARLLRVTLAETRRRRDRPEAKGLRLFPRSADAGREGVPPVAEGESALRVSGTKRLEVSVGTGADAALTQSLRVDVSGEVAPGVDLRAVLTDQNLPAASGSTRRLDELDRVFFQVRAPSVRADLGDLDVRFDGTTFGRYRRQLQGADLAWGTDRADVDVFGAVSQGRSLTVRLAGREGYQGPYRVGSGPVVAASERVTLDGVDVHRGEGQDYVFDYDRGLLTFTPGRPVHGDSRISVTYQAFDSERGLRVVGARAHTIAAGERLRVGATYLQESAGAAPSAVASGAAREAADPGTQRVSVLDATYGAPGGPSLAVELAASGADSADGKAVRLSADTGERLLRAGRREMGSLRLRLGYRDASRGFGTLDRVQTAAEEGTWGWRPEEGALAGRVAEALLRYAPWPRATIDAEVGRRTGDLDAGRSAARLSYRGSEGEWLKSAEAGVNRVRQAGGEVVSRQARIEGPPTALRPRAHYADERATGTAVSGSSLFYAAGVGDASSSPRGVGVREAGFALGTVEGRRAGWTSSVVLRQSRLLVDAWTDSVRTLTHQHRLDLSGPGGMTLSADGSQSRVTGPPGAGRTTNLGRVRLAASPAGGALAPQVSYRISSVGATDDRPVHVFVGEGNGRFAWEDVDGDDAFDPEEFVAEPGGDYDLFPWRSVSFTPVREAALLARLGVDGRRLAKHPSGLLGQAVSGAALDLLLETDRRSEPGGPGVAPWSLAGFREDSLLASAHREVRGTLHLLRTRKDLSLRFESRWRDGLDRSLSEGGRVHEEGRTLYARWRPARAVEVETTMKDVVRLREGEGPFAYDTAGRSGEVRTLFRLGAGWQTGLSLGAGREREGLRGILADRLTIEPEWRRSLPGRGRLTSSLDWTRVLCDTPVPLFLGLAEGNRPGDNLIWRVGMDYRLGQYVSAFVSYDGRKRPERPVLHYGRMEVRATF